MSDNSAAAAPTSGDGPICTVCGKQATRQDIDGEWWPPCEHAKTLGLHTLQFRAAAPTSEQIAEWRDMVQAEADSCESDAATLKHDPDRESARNEASRWRALDALLETLSDRAARVGMTETTDTERLDKLMRFAGNALAESRVDEIGDWDGGSMQQALVDFGLIEQVEREVPCGEGCRCNESYSEGETAICFPLTELGHEAVAAFRAWQDHENAVAASARPDPDTAASASRRG